MNTTNLAEPELLEFNGSESNARYYCREMPAVFVRASNAKVWDEQGHEYIDFLSSCGSLNYGHNHPLMRQAAINYLASDGILNALDLHTESKRRFLRAFRENILEPRNLSYRVQFTGPTGANAVEAALKLARKLTGRRMVVAFTNAFHGMSLGAMAVSARQHHNSGTGVELNNVVRLPYEGYAGASTNELDRYEAMVLDPSGGMEAPAAFMVEVVQGEGGLNCASSAWLRHLAGVAKRLGALLIVDDVQGGCGRTGDFFSFERSGIVPDIVCLAKSVSGIGLPMAVLLIKPECDVWAPGEHNGTFRGNNLAFVAATIATQLWRDPTFKASLDRSAAIVAEWIRRSALRFGASPRGRGLFAGLAFPNRSLARAVAVQSFKMKVLIETSGPNGEVLKILPPLTIEEDTLNEGLQRLSAAMEISLSREKLRSAA